MHSDGGKREWEGRGKKTQKRRNHENDTLKIVLFRYRGTI